MQVRSKRFTVKVKHAPDNGTEGMWFMESSKGFKKYENCILTFVVMAAGVLLMAICFDFYYDLNDDTMMKDIMSGIYSGTPDGHNMQTLYPLGAFIALCYRLCGQIPWYGLFLCVCQFGCFYLIGVRLCAIVKRYGMRGKIVLLALLMLFQWGICLFHLVHIQYTITCAVMSATALFLFLTTPDGISAQQFVVKNIPSITLVILAYQLRTEMLLLTFPFICLAGLYRMAEEKKLFVKETLWKYGAVIGLILLGMGLSSAADYAAYSGAEWKAFRDFFDARTTVYDFYPELITDKAYSGALDELGVSAAQQTLLTNYNFGLDDAIDTQMMTQMADYASHTLGGAKDWTAIARKQTAFYGYRLFHKQDAPYNLLVLCAYAAVAAAGLAVCHGSREDEVQAVAAVQGDESARDMIRTVRCRYAFVWQLVLLAAVRSAIWMFILMRGRDPVRITDSLYLVEFALLSGRLVRMLGSYQRRADAGKRGALRLVTAFCMVLMAGTMAAGTADGVRKVREEQMRRAQVNEDWYEIDAYCRRHPQDFYFEDVYSTVGFSQKIFGKTDNSYANYDILGGWMCKSPLYDEKLRRSDIVSAGRALIGQENVYLIMSDTELSVRGTGWLEAYYASQGARVTVEETGKIGEHYLVYRVEEE